MIYWGRMAVEEKGEIYWLDYGLVSPLDVWGPDKAKEDWKRGKVWKSEDHDGCVLYIMSEN